MLELDHNIKMFSIYINVISLIAVPYPFLHVLFNETGRVSLESFEPELQSIAI